MIIEYTLIIAGVTLVTLIGNTLTNIRIYHELKRMSHRHFRSVKEELQKTNKTLFNVKTCLLDILVELHNDEKNDTDKTEQEVSCNG